MGRNNAVRCEPAIRVEAGDLETLTDVGSTVPARVADATRAEWPFDDSVTQVKMFDVRSEFTDDADVFVARNTRRLDEIIRRLPLPSPDVTPTDSGSLDLHLNFERSRVRHGSRTPLE